MAKYVIELLQTHEADTSLNAQEYPEWNALTDAFKLTHIRQASSYIQLNWEAGQSIASGFRWDVKATWPQGTDRVIALYADAAGKGILYPQRANSTAPVRSQTVKVGSLEQTTSYAESSQDVIVPNTNAIADQFRILGFERKNRIGQLTRV